MIQERELKLLTKSSKILIPPLTYACIPRSAHYFNQQRILANIEEGLLSSPCPRAHHPIQSNDMRQAGIER